jgi:alpha-tubulin suppressor-like RCC1 family protein
MILAERQGTEVAGAFLELAVGESFTCGIKSDRTITCWGISYLGKTAPPAGTYSASTGGSDFACGIAVDGSTICWGSNADGRATPP